MQFPEDVVSDAQLRLRRLEGQVRGVQRMLDEGKDCRDVMTQIAAAKAALDRVGYRLMAAGIRYCATHPEAAVEQGMDAEEMEKLFMKLS